MTFTAGGEFYVNSTYDGTQTPNYHGHTVTGLPGGGYVIVWQGVSADGTFDIYMQRYANDGERIGGETVVNGATNFDQQLPQVTSLKDGGYIVAWTSYSGADSNGVPTGGDIHFQRYNAAGTKVGAETTANTYKTSEQDTPSIIGLGDGGWVVTWDSKGQDGDSYGEYGQRFDSNGNKVGGEIHLSGTTAGTQDSSAIVAFAGGLAVVYNSSPLGTDGAATNYDVKMRIFDTNGNPVGSEVTVASGTGHQDFVSASNYGGGFVVTWVDNSAGANQSKVMQQLFNADGSLNGAATQVNNTGHSGDAVDTGITYLLDGGYVVTWSMSNSTNASGGPADYEVYAQQYSSAGAKVGGELHVNLGTAGNQIYSSVAVLSSGSFVVTWRSPDQWDAGVPVSTGVSSRIYFMDHVVTDTAGHNSHLTGDGTVASWLYGLDGDDTLDGGPGLSTDRLYGGDGNDTLVMRGGDYAEGGTGNDTYMIVELNGMNFQFIDTGGYDTIDTTEINAAPQWYLTNSQSADEYRGGGFNDNVDAHWTTNVPVFTFHGGGGNDVVIAGSGNDQLFGDSGNDSLDGGIGNDAMAGGSGNDTYFVDSLADTVSEASGAGTDTVNSLVDFTLGANVEKLNLTGTGNTNGTGNALNNTIIGNSGNNTLGGGGGNDALTAGDGNDVLDGGTGADTLKGGAGDDTYYVDDSGDVVSESTGQGKDTVYSTVSFHLGAALEKLILTGSAAIDGSGSSNNNTITGNDAANLLSGGGGTDVLYGKGGNDTLDGGSGSDTMKGGTGDDTYIVDSTGDVVTEYSNEGTDTVQASITYVLGGGVERLILTGTGNIDGSGNSADNRLTGNDGNNVLKGGSGLDTLYGNGGNDRLDGGTGADTMKGGAGNDTYVVDNTGDVVTETDGQGTDTVEASITYTLHGYVENLILTGSANIDGVGNSYGNNITGNAANNVLKGYSGNDLLNGKGGNDTLYGGSGADTFFFNHGSGADTIADFSAADNDQINVHVYSGGVAGGGGVTLTQDGADVTVHLGSGNQITVSNALLADVQAHIIW